ncbi:hypothetical protein DY000_02046224 [Brassica cretica]|uniref:VTT domain-containing protein n=1 Tax=Brassica cretica TaxID=69181 RepID=A0ABQ7EWS6_BRACR|nr:hypothetical protein DY000_02046224 [Brassica cretica]
MRSLTLTLRSSSLPFTFTSSSSFRRFHFLKPCSSSLKQTKKQQHSLRRSPPPSTAPPPKSLRWFFNPKSSDDEDDDDDDAKSPKAESDEASGGDAAVKGTILAGVLLIGTVGGFAGVGYVYRDQINTFLTQFSTFIEGYGPAGYALFIAILAIPALPLTMSAGLLFGSLVGTIIVSVSGTMAASVAFLIARYFARERILKLVEGNKKFLAIDKAIGENGFRVVTLLRLSPLLPFSLGNYLYGLTSVKFVPYVLGSWLGMLPGSWAYVSAGAFGRAIIDPPSFYVVGCTLGLCWSALVYDRRTKLKARALKESYRTSAVGSHQKQEESTVGLPGGNGQLLTLGLGLLVTAVAATYVTGLAKQEESTVGLPGGNGQLLTLGLGLLVTAVAATYVTGLAKDAIKDIDDE